MTWADIAARPTRPRWIAVLPLAAVEQHGPHLPLGVDSLHRRGLPGARPQAPSRADLPVTFLPVQRIGESDEHLALPGTLTLSAATVIRAWTEIGESVARAGVRKLVLITSHGGNVAAMEIVARDLRVRHGMLAVTVRLAPLRLSGRHVFGAEERRHGIHGGDIETSLMLAGHGDTVRMEKRRGRAR